MPRFVLAVIVALLTFSASGAHTLIVVEPCSGFEQSERNDNVCPPTCVTCGCCAQAIEPMNWHIASSPDALIAGVQLLVPFLLDVQTRDILHVPKTRLA